MPKPKGGSRARAPAAVEEANATEAGVSVPPGTAEATIAAVRIRSRMFPPLPPGGLPSDSYHHCVSCYKPSVPPHALGSRSGTSRLEHEDGTPADPPTFRPAVPNWRAGDVIPLGRRSLRVVEVRDDDADQAPTLVVEDVA